MIIKFIAGVEQYDFHCIRTNIYKVINSLTKWVNPKVDVKSIVFLIKKEETK